MKKSNIKISNIQYPIFNIKYLILLFFILYSLLFFVIPVFADSPPPGSPSLGQEITTQMDIAGQQTGLGANDPRAAVARIINYSLGLVGIIFLAYVVYAGYLWMTAGGEDEKITEAKNHLKNGLIGLIIILAALSISLIITTYIIRATKFEFYQPPLPYGTIQ